MREYGQGPLDNVGTMLYIYHIYIHLPLAIERRISDLSSSEEIFNQSKSYYQEALKKSGYKHELTYAPSVSLNGNQTKRTRRIIWFNPPFSKTVITNIGRKFLYLVNKYFPKSHKLH